MGGPGSGRKKGSGRKGSGGVKKQKGGTARAIDSYWKNKTKGMNKLQIAHLKVYGS